jgi:hypothetical protein|tara:strand:+ start:76 stop:216 length:141 start_codon:yes stop_codon:yes gene_type:complete
MTTNTTSFASFQGSIFLIEEIIDGEVILSDQDGGEIVVPISSVDFL